MNNQCPSCGAVYSVTTQHVGRRIACKKCGAPLVVEVGGLALAAVTPADGEVPSTAVAVDAAVTPSAPVPISNQSIPSLTLTPALPPSAPPSAVAFDGDRLARTPRGPSAVFEFLTFRRMLTPAIIQVLFWLGVLGCVVAGIVTILFALLNKEAGMFLMLVGLGEIIIGPVLVRIYCEMVMVVFRINQDLYDIKAMMEKRSGEKSG